MVYLTYDWILKLPKSVPTVAYKLSIFVYSALKFYLLFDICFVLGILSPSLYVFC
jgi:hypothetical protein